MITGGICAAVGCLWIIHLFKKHRWKIIRKPKAMLDVAMSTVITWLAFTASYKAAVMLFVASICFSAGVRFV